MSLKLIHVGVGGRGSHWLDFVAQREDVESVACMDVDEQALQAVQERFGCPSFNDSW